LYRFDDPLLVPMSHIADIFHFFRF
jgi:hypothetical protein